MPWNKIPVEILSKIFLGLLNIFSLLKKANIKKPIATIPNLKAKAANGDALLTISFPDINADDHSNIKNKGKYFIIFWILV